MIYFTTFILALFLTQFACAQQQTCGDPRSPELLIQDEQQNLPNPAITHASHTIKYDNKTGVLSKTACSNLHYKHFANIPSYPRIGGYYGIKPHSPNCGDCYNITNKATHRFIYVTIIDSADFGYFNLSDEAFKLLNKNEVGKPIVIGSNKVPNSYCSH